MTELPRIEAMDGRFEALLRPDSRFELVADGLVFAEGPLWMPEDEALVWSDVRAGRMWRWTREGGAAVLRDPSGIANGNALDGEGRLITCEMRGRRIGGEACEGVREPGRSASMCMASQIYWR